MTKSRVVRAAEKARRAQEAPEIVRDIIGAPAVRDRCVYCGGPAPKKDGVCRGHRDLGGFA
jgi:hypothetical protein